jgi:hypothetical protein
MSRGRNADDAVVARVHGLPYLAFLRLMIMMMARLDEA